MFNTGKRLVRIEEQLRVIENQNRKEPAGQARQETVEQILARLDGLRTDLAEAKDAVNRHDRVMEDMLDAWDDIRDDQREQITRLEKETGEVQKLRASDSIRQTETLIHTVISLCDQMFALQQTAAQAGNEIWKAQIDRMTEQQTNALALSGIQVIGRAGDQFSFDLHEAVQTLETDHAELDYRLAEVIRCGYLYQGKVIRKAQTAVWRMHGEV